MRRLYTFLDRLKYNTDQVESVSVSTKSPKHTSEYIVDLDVTRHGKNSKMEKKFDFGQFFDGVGVFSCVEFESVFGGILSNEFFKKE